MGVIRTGRWRPASGWRLLAALPLLAPATALAVDWDVYGRLNLSIERYSGGGYGAWDLASNSSRLGFDVEHQLETGLTVLGEVEQQIAFNRGDGLEWASRSALLGLRDSWGTLRLGYMNSAVKDLRGRFDLFSGEMGDSRNILRGEHKPHFDSRFPAGVRLTTPEGEGWGFDLHYSFDTQDEDDDPPADDNEHRAYAAVVDYQWPALSLAFGTERSYGDEDKHEGEVFRLGAEWAIGDDWTLIGFGQHSKEAWEVNGEYEDADGYGLGLRHRLADDLELRGQYYAIDADASGHGGRMAVIGAVFHADERTRLYVTYANLNNDSASQLVPWHHGRVAGPEGNEDGVHLDAGSSTWAVASGVRVDF
ncbi:porin [Halorhodospira halophila]|uniref:porin n=1 Tax=Halorhodospira halophila TaxID=1053 RepID=UPI0019132D82|nr:porin [Halorhodospira halophila]MBK5935353.1 hypothetical protein [Halorhodospira halophila]